MPSRPSPVLVFGLSWSLLASAAWADEAAERQRAEAQVSEDLALLAQEGRCGAALAGVIDWKSFGSATHRSADGRFDVNVGGYCLVAGPLTAFCTKYGPEAVRALSKFRCAYQAGGTTALDEGGVDVKVDGDTLTLLVNLRGDNQDERVLARLPTLMTVREGSGRVTAEEAWNRRFQERSLAEDTELLAQEGRCGLTLTSTIDWASFGSATHRRADGSLKGSISGYCSVASVLSAYCLKYGKAGPLSGLSRLRCVYQPRGNADVDATGWDAKREGDTLTIFTNLDGVNAHLNFDPQVLEVIPPPPGADAKPTAPVRATPPRRRR